MYLQALHADKRLKELGKQGRIIIEGSGSDIPRESMCARKNSTCDL
jgi:hypothetical protein